MKERIDAFIPLNDQEQTQSIVDYLSAHYLVNNIFVFADKTTSVTLNNCKILNSDSLFSAETLNLIAEKSTVDFTMILTHDDYLEFGQNAIERFLNVAVNSNAGLVYSDYYEIKNDERKAHPVIDYQIGALRDDFDFGKLLFYSTSAVKEAVAELKSNLSFSALYYLRLKVSVNKSFQRIPEFLYSTISSDDRKSGAKVFDYVDPKNRSAQIEMEEVVTQHLKNIGAYLPPNFAEPDFDSESFKTLASVIIPVFNRVSTIGDAVDSVMKQKTDFDFNLIVVDNHSSDGTTEKLEEYSKKYNNLIHIIPERTDLGIGGCWNVAVESKHCGKFALQLDSDDIYSDEDTIQTIVDKFNEEKCAMVVGSYKITDFELNDIPPGLVDHKEWTLENGRNNALRINGLGAPRAFFTPLLRKIKVPNVSYGEDYAVGLEVSRNYKIGRIYTPIYLCRRWDGNSDAALPIEKVNAHNTYKDRVRSFEVLARQKMQK